MVEMERLLSKENLSEDKYIAGALKPQLCVPLTTLLNAPSIKALGVDRAALIAAAEKSSTLSLSEDKMMVRPLLKAKRNTVILRDVPVDATEAELRSFVEGAKAGAAIKVSQEIGNQWFVTFETEKNAMDVALWIRSQQFKGQKLSAGIKTEHILRSFFTPPPGNTGAGAPAAPAVAPRPFMPVMGWKGKGAYPAMSPAVADFSVPDFSMPMVADQANLPANILDNFGRKGGRGRGRGGKDFGMKGFDDPFAKGKGKGKGKRKKEEEELPDTAFLQKFQNQEQEGEPADPVPCEYTHDFRKYSRDEIREICASMGNNNCPDELKAEAHSDLIAKEPEGWASESVDEPKGKGK